MTTQKLKHCCDRCGSTLEIDLDEMSTSRTYPKDWQRLHLGQTGAKLDLCDSCNDALLAYLNAQGAKDMKLATHNERAVL